VFESRRVHGFLSFAEVMCCQLEVNATGCSLLQRSLTDCGGSGCDRGNLTVRKLAHKGLPSHEKIILFLQLMFSELGRTT